MSADTLTFELSGRVSLAKFAEAMKRFQKLIADLSADMSTGDLITWDVEDLNKGSAITTVQGTNAPAEDIERVVVAYGTIGRALERRSPIPYSNRIQRDALNLAKLVDGSVTALRFETEFIDAIVGPQLTAPVETPTITYSYGAIKGRVETLTSRRGLRFTVYDAIFDRPISCYLREGQEDHMRNAWERRVVVTGLIGREPETKRPVVVRDIQNIEILSDATTGDYRLARGALGSHDKTPPAEVIIRSMRDGE
jgi:hypothetical protein